MRRWTWIGAAIVAIAAALPLALFAISSAAAPDGKGRPAGPPAAIELAPSPLRITCDGSDPSTLRVRLTDDDGKPVADGTDVFFDVRYGFAHPVETQTSKGDATTQVRLYPFAEDAFPAPEVFVYAGDLRASINIGCDDGGGEPGCNPFSPPQHPASPPCPTQTPFPTPCGGPSPPCPTPCDSSASPPCPTPCDSNASPPCVTPTPCGEHPMSPPCVPATNTPTSTPTSTPQLGDALYELGLFGQTQANNQVTLAVYILDLGGGPYQAAQWHVDYDEQNVGLISIERATPAPTECVASADDGSRALLGCLSLIVAEPIDYFGDAWLLTFNCLTDGVFDYRLRTGPDVISGSAVLDAFGDELPIQTTDTQVGCGKDISTPAPSQTPADTTPTPCAEPCITPTPTPLFQLGVVAQESPLGVITTDLFITDTGGNAYEAAQWFVDYPEDLVDVTSFSEADGSPPACDFMDDDGSRLLARCDFPGDANGLSRFGPIFVVTFTCLQTGSSPIEPSGATFVRISGAPVNIVTLNSTLICSQAPTPVQG